MYTAAVLENAATLQLRTIAADLVDLSSYVFITAAGMQLPHHMTINMDRFSESLNDKRIMNHLCQIQIDGIAYNHKLGVCAARVSNAVANDKDVKSSNPQRHITIAIKPTSKPAFSNQLTWTEKDDDHFISIAPIIVLGTIQECA